MADQTGEADLRAENVSKVVTGFARASYIFKSLCTIDSSAAWKETYFQETATVLTGGTGSPIEEIPREAAFPQLYASWTEQSSRQKKYGGEGIISYEDKKFNDVDVISRTLIRIAEAVTAAVDAEIWDVITEGRSVININTFAIPVGEEWDSVNDAARDPIQNLLDAKTEISDDNYEPNGASLLLSAKDYAKLLGNPNIRNAGQFWTNDPSKKGTLGMIAGLKIRKSNNVTADYAAIVIDKTAATWKQGVALTTVTKEDPGISTTIRSWEVGTCQLKNPKAVCLITNTQKT